MGQCTQLWGLIMLSRNAVHDSTVEQVVEIKSSLEDLMWTISKV